MRNLLPRIRFINETSLKTNMAKTTGWSGNGAGLIDHTPFGHWNTQTFIAAMRHDRLNAPWIISERDELKTLRALCRDPTGPDLATRRSSSTTCHSTKAQRPPRPCARLWHGYCFCRLTPLISTPSKWHPPKLKALIQGAAARTYDDLWHAVGHVCDLFTDVECYNFFKAAGYETD